MRYSDVTATALIRASSLAVSSLPSGISSPPARLNDGYSRAGRSSTSICEAPMPPATNGRKPLLASG